MYATLMGNNGLDGYIHAALLEGKNSLLTQLRRLLGICPMMARRISPAAISLNSVPL